MLTKLNTTRIGQVIGNLIEVDFALVFGVALRRYIKIKVELNVHKPLPEGFNLPRPNGTINRIFFKYEKLSELCYMCGRLGHIQQACPDVISKQDNRQYGQWMRVSNGGNKRGNPFEFQYQA